MPSHSTRTSRPGRLDSLQETKSSITRKLWGLYNSGPFMHHGKFTTMREAITLGHHGEATATRMEFQALTSSQQDDVIEFLKSLQVLPPGTPCLVVDERNHCLQSDDADQ